MIPFIEDTKLKIINNFLRLFISFISLLNLALLYDSITCTCNNMYVIELRKFFSMWLSRRSQPFNMEVLSDETTFNLLFYIHIQLFTFYHDIIKIGISCCNWSNLLTKISWLWIVLILNVYLYMIDSAFLSSQVVHEILYWLTNNNPSLTNLSWQSFREMVEDIIAEQIANIMVLPNRIAVPMIEELNLSLLKYPPPEVS